jgi:hypothetical protein
VIAAAKLFTGRYWIWTVIFFQYAMSLCATVLVYRVAREFRVGVWLSLFIAMAQATNMQFVVDQALLTDSLCGSLATIATCMLAVSAKRGKPVGLVLFLTVGILLATAFLVRPVVEFLAIAFMPLALAAILVEPTTLRKSIAAMLVVVPMVATHLAYVAWNKERVGAPIVTTISQAALFGALEEAAKNDPKIFSGESPFDIVGRRVFENFIVPGKIGYDAEPSIILHRDYGWDAVRISREATSAYLRAWWQYPAAMFRHIFHDISESHLH